MGKLINFKTTVLTSNSISSLFILSVAELSFSSSNLNEKKKRISTIYQEKASKFDITCILGSKPSSSSYLDVSLSGLHCPIDESIVKTIMIQYLFKSS